MPILDSKQWALLLNLPVSPSETDSSNFDWFDSSVEERLTSIPRLFTAIEPLGIALVPHTVRCGHSRY